MTIGPLFFAAPWALAALLALPVLWLVLRAAPPLPQRVVFPPLRLLLGLQTAEETKGRPPLWLLALRALAIAVLVLGFARPSLAPDGQTEAPLAGPALIVIDDGWTSAAGFDEVRAAAAGWIDRAERGRQAVALAFTAPGRASAPDSLDMLTPADARARLARAEPKPWRPDRGATAARISATPQSFSQTVWLSDGLADANTAKLAQALQSKAPLTIRAPARAVVAITDVRVDAKGVTAMVRRSSPLTGDGVAAAETADGRPLGAADVVFPPGSLETAAVFALPGEIAARVARVRLLRHASAGGVRLIPNAAGRPVVGMLDPGSQGQPLLSDLYYVDRAIAPFAQVRRGGVASLTTEGAQALVMPDASRLTPVEERTVLRWLESGGLLIRFAGPRLANDSDTLAPTPLRRGARQLGGALAWEAPQGLRAFDADSPFFGLEIPSDVAVSRHVMTRPDAEARAQVWARLSDGAPIITAAARGKGQIILFHITAGPEWSNLPLSGLYVEMLRRSLSLIGRPPKTGQDARVGAGPFVLTRAMNGTGEWAAPPADLAPILAERFDGARAGPHAPPGLYERNGVTAAIQTMHADESLSPLGAVAGARMVTASATPPRPLDGLFLGLGGALIALDLLLALWLSGRLPRRLRLPRRATPTAVAILASAFVFQGAPAFAQSADRAAPSDVQLAFVRTGDARTDAVAKAGLDRLAATLRERTAVEPGATIGVDLARDDLSVFPILYWAAPATPRPLTDAALANLDRYMRLGGMVLVDTRDAGRNPSAGPAAIMLRGLDAPPLEPVSGDHVLTKSYYLIQSFPGRFDGARLFAESASAAAARDGVPSLLIGDGDWAAAWASATPTDAIAWDDSAARRRELAMRFGVNLVMVALTGNYKSDQVHVPALLERLGGDRPPR